MRLAKELYCNKVQPNLAPQLTQKLPPAAFVPQDEQKLAPPPPPPPAAREGGGD